MKTGNQLMPLVVLLSSAILLACMAVMTVHADDTTDASIQKTWEADFRELRAAIEKQKQAQPPVDLRQDPHVYDAQALIWPTDRDPLDVVLRRALALAADLARKSNGSQLREAEQKLKALQQQSQVLGPEQNAPARKALYLEVCALRRRLALANPLLDFNKILFTTGEPIGGAVQGHIKGDSAKKGDLYVLSGFNGDAPQTRKLLQGAKVMNGRNQGQPLKGGAFNTLDLSFDGKTLVFEWCAKRPPADPGPDSIFNPSQYTRDNTFNIKSTWTART